MNAIFKQNYAIKLFITFKMAYSCCLSLGGKSRLSRFPPKMFYNIDYWSLGLQHAQNSLKQSKREAASVMVSVYRLRLMKRAKKTSIFQRETNT